LVVPVSVLIRASGAAGPESIDAGGAQLFAQFESFAANLDLSPLLHSPPQSIASRDPFP
jgi:hypothetical protein